MYFLYVVLNIFLLPLYFILSFYRLLKKRDDFYSFCNRFAIPTIKRPKGEIIWFHVASVGEMLSVKRLINDLASGKKILLTSFTKNSKQIFPQHFSHNVWHQTICFDNIIFIKIFLYYWKPKEFLLVESEIWPSLIWETSKITNPIFLNSKISDKDCRFWRYCPSFFSNILAKFKYNLPQSKIDFERFAEFYSRNLKFIGNIKYAAQLETLDRQLIEKISRKIIGKKIITIASTHKGEEEIILSSLSELIKRDNIFVFLAPRHIDRKKEVEEILGKYNINYINRTKSLDIDEKTKLMLVDTLGELNNFYSMTDIAIVCGSFNYVVGGHNIIEPAKFSNAIIVGPNMKNFQEILEEFLNNNAVIQINEPNLLAAKIDEVLNNQELFTKLQKNAFNLTKFYYNIYPEVKNFIDKQFKVQNKT